MSNIIETALQEVRERRATLADWRDEGVPRRRAALIAQFRFFNEIESQVRMIGNALRAVQTRENGRRQVLDDLRKRRRDALKALAVAERTATDDRCHVARSHEQLAVSGISLQAGLQIANLVGAAGSVQIAQHQRREHVRLFVRQHHRRGG